MRSEWRQNSVTTSAAIAVTVVQASVSISPVLPALSDRQGNVGLGYMAIAGSIAAVTMAVNPQISVGQERDVLTLECVGSSVTFIHGSGLTLLGGQRFRMDSGSIITFMYTTANTTWQETSRTR